MFVWLTLGLIWLAPLTLVLFDATRGDAFWDLKASHLVTTLLSLAILVVSYFQWTTYERQATIMETQDQTSKAAQRPWLSVGVPRAANAFPVGVDGGAFVVDFELKNHGNSPAVNVEVDVTLPMMRSNLGAFAIQEEICKKLKERPTGNNGVGLPIFPQESLTKRIAISLNPGEVSQATKAMGLPTPSFRPVMIGCVRYFSPADNSQHETGFAFYVSHQPPNSLLETDNGDVPPEQILFISPSLLSGRIN